MAAWTISLSAILLDPIPKNRLADSIGPWSIKPLKPAPDLQAKAAADTTDLATLLREKVRPPQNDVMNGPDLYKTDTDYFIRPGALNFKKIASRGFSC